MTLDKEELAARYSDATLKLLRSSKIPPTPPFYELLYTYSTGSNQDLNIRINEVFERGEQPDMEMAEALHEEFMQPNDVSARLNVVSAEIATQLESVFSVLNESTDAATTYSTVLENVTDDLETGLDQKAISKLTATLLSETQKMKTSNASLESNLASARGDIEGLQQELDEVRRESLIDPLTKINNRKAFDEGLKAGIKSARQDGKPLALVITDIDHFKKFNDTHGHQTGDQVLRLVAMTLSANVKSKDIAARYGGEEFAIILPDTSLGKARQIAEKMREAVQARVLLKRSTNEKLGRVTASFGVALFSPDDTAETFLERADACLYAAKDEGRNCVIAESSGVMQTQAVA